MVLSKKWGIHMGYTLFLSNFNGRMERFTRGWNGVLDIFGRNLQFSPRNLTEHDDPNIRFPTHGEHPRETYPCHLVEGSSQYIIPIGVIKHGTLGQPINEGFHSLDRWENPRSKCWIFLASHVWLPTGKWTFFRDHPTIRGNKPFTARWCPILSNIGIGLHLG